MCQPLTNPDRFHSKGWTQPSTRRLWIQGSFITIDPTVLQHTDYTSFGELCERLTPDPEVAFGSCLHPKWKELSGVADKPLWFSKLLVILCWKASFPCTLCSWLPRHVRWKGSIFLPLNKDVEKERRDIVTDYSNNLVTSPPFNVLQSSVKAWRATGRGLCTGRSHQPKGHGSSVWLKKKPTVNVWLYMGMRRGKEHRCLTRKIQSNTGVGVKQLAWRGGRIICRYRVILLKGGSEASLCRWSGSE